MNSDFLMLMQERVAVGSIPISTVRRMGPNGTMTAAQRFLCNQAILERFAIVQDEASFTEILDEETIRLKSALPISEDGLHGRYWGTARKCLNIFLYECLLNLYLSAEYKLFRLEPWLEVPLDGLVGTEVRKQAKLDGTLLPAWDGVIYLDDAVSARYQNAALKIAVAKGIHRVHLELYYYRAE